MEREKTRSKVISRKKTFFINGETPFRIVYGYIILFYRRKTIAVLRESFADADFVWIGQVTADLYVEVFVRHYHFWVMR